MKKFVQILTLTLISLVASCNNTSLQIGDDSTPEVIATVDNHELLRSDIARDIPNGLSDADSITFVRMYIENWVLNQLKISRAEEVLSSHQKEIERLVEGYRQSLIMRQLDQYYIDSAIDLEITDKQLSAYYRANSASFKLDHNKVRGVVVKAPRNYRNTTTLTTALKSVKKRGNTEELRALCEKHNLQFTDNTPQWVSYSDFLSNLPTERSSSYVELLSKSDVQQMTSDGAVFYFIIIDVARKGEVAPLECVKEDIRRRLYAERRSEIVEKYEAELKREAMLNGRVTLTDTLLIKSMSYIPTPKQDIETTIIEAEEQIEEDVPNVILGTSQESNDNDIETKE